MGSKQEIRRGIKSRQLKSGKLFIGFDGSLATPLAIGPDKYAVSSIDKLATGQYKINLNTAYEQSLFMCGVSTVEGRLCKVVASDASSITITFTDNLNADADTQVACLEIATFDFHIFH